MPPTSLFHPNFIKSDPGTCDSGMRDYTNRTSQSLMEDIPDVEAYERDFETGSTSAFPLLSANNFDSSGVLPERDIHKIPNVQYNIGINRQITPKQEILDDDTSMIACTGPSTKIIQRSGIKMEVPPYLDPDSKDDDPEDGVVYPEPNLFDVKNTNMSEYDLEVLKLGKEVVDEARGKIDAPDASAPPNKIVEYLMFYRTLKESELIQLNAYRTKRNRLSLNLVKNNVDREFDQKACESLVKKLKDKKQDLQNLIDVVVTKGKSYTGCITIPRTLDGRLQVHGRKGFPHVVYGKLWRFSEMTKNETRNVEHCNHAFEMKSDLVCVNPYHYEQVIGTMIVGQRDNSDLRDIQSHSSVQQR
uniref:MH1 domain-containing protein n=1 Tax=Caenorhabditis japonica TaxID=281687 RepID=A0A8R1DNX2_CAEJA